MFTGLVSELGQIKSSLRQSNSYKLLIKAKLVLEDLKLGDSVAVNGACLTVIDISSNSFTVDVMPETANKTLIPAFKSGERVNLERTVRVGDRLDGHIVTGHIDFTGLILDVKKDEIANVFTIRLPREAMRYVVRKGSVAIDGISLTVCDVGDDWFGVSIIPHTAQNTTLGFKKKGDYVNIETDVLGKYVEKFLGLKEKDFTAKLFENGFMEG